MNLKIELTLDVAESDKTKERVKDAQSKKAKASIEPTWEQVWHDGYGKKKGIFQMALSDADREKLMELKRAIEAEEIGLSVESLRSFSKSYALELFKQLTMQRKQSIIEKMVAETPKNYRLITTEQQLDELIRDLTRESIVAVDTETTGLNVYTDVIVGISFTLPQADYHVYIPVGHTSGKQMSRSYVLNRLTPVLYSSSIGKVLHNAKFDLHMFIRHGVRMNGLVHDTRVAMALLNENEVSFALKNLANRYGKFFGYQDDSYTYEQLFGKVNFAEISLDVALVYAAKDTHLTWKLYEWQLEHLKKRRLLYKLYTEMENPLIDVCVDMEQAGFLVDLEFAKEYGIELKEEIQQIEQQLKEHFGEINFNSPIQLARVLYDELQLPDYNKRSTDVKTLKILKEEHAGVELLLKYRELVKLLGTYIEALPQLIKDDGRVHGSFNQVSTVTGRFSSSDPNLQNLPPRARRLIISPDGKVIIGIDFSQIEPRLLAHLSGDKKLQEAYLNGQDLYSTMASNVFKVPIEECGDGSKYRKMMKVGLLAVMYGTSMFTLAQQLGISVQEAHTFIEQFFDTYPDVHRFIKSVHEFVKENEYVETMFNRKRRFLGHKEEAKVYDALAAEICRRLGMKSIPHYFWDKKYKEKLPYDLKRKFQNVKGKVERVRRMAVNAIIQGTAADIMKRALLNLHKYCKSQNWEVIGTVHDEALLLVENTININQIQEIEKCMTSTVSLDIPLKVDTEIMTRWGEGKLIGEWFKLVA